MRKVVLCGVLALACLLGGFRIYQVNTADFITLFPQRQYFSTGEPVPLEKGHYYFTSYDWTGYTVEVTGSTVKSTDDFLQEHNAPENFLEDLNLRDDLHHKNQYLLLVHTVFRYNGEDSMEKMFCLGLALGMVGGALIVITHNTRILERLEVDRTHVMVHGRMVAEGPADLIADIDRNGFERFEKCEDCGGCPMVGDAE